MDARERYDSLFQFFAERDGLDWHLLKAQAIAESNLNPRAVSRAGAMGLTQFMPKTFAEITGRWQFQADPFNPEHAIRAQAIFMRDLLEQMKGDVAKALASYNAGPGRVRRSIQVNGDDWLDFLPVETKFYVPKVLNLFRDLGGPDAA